MTTGHVTSTDTIGMTRKHRSRTLDQIRQLGYHVRTSILFGVTTKISYLKLRQDEKGSVVLAHFRR
ncbi:hypothetical protein [Nocardia lasii]|uniref:Uncharacterized protein n=1 Tax=Nocardia lasii TaxID=1616107 RepID=A0ABW1JS18_9NOCA